MASYYDSPQVQLPEFVPEFNLELYASALAQMNKKYDEGLQKVEQYRETVAGLPVGRDVDKRYLQDKVNALNSEIAANAGSDFADPNLISKFKGMASKIYSDANVQTAINSASHARSQQTIMQEAKKNGKSNKANENFYNYQYQQWAQGTEVGQAFNADFIEYTDIQKEALDMWKGLHPDSEIRMAPNGSAIAYTMTKYGLVQMNPNQIRKELDGLIASNSNWQQQIGISSWDAYKGYDAKAMEPLVTETHKMEKKDLDLRRNILLSQKRDYVGDALGLADIEDNIKEVEQKIKDLPNEQKKEIEELTTDPNKAKASIYKKNLTNTLSSMLGYREFSQTTESNPAYTNWSDNEKRNNEYLKNSADKTQSSQFGGTTLQPIGTAQDQDAVTTYNNTINDTDKILERDKLNMLYMDTKGREFFQEFRYDNEDGSTNYDVTYKGNTPEERKASQAAAEKYYQTEIKHKWDNGTLADGPTRDAMTEIAKLEDLNKVRKGVVNKVEAEWQDHLKKNKDNPKYKMAQRLDGINLAPVRTRSSDGTDLDIDKSSILDAFDYITMAEQTPSAAMLAATFTPFGPTKREEVFLSAKRNVTAEKNLTDAQKKKLIASIDYAEQNYFNVVDPLGSGAFRQSAIGSRYNESTKYTGRPKLTPEQNSLAQLHQVALEAPGALRRSFGALEGATTGTGYLSGEYFAVANEEKEFKNKAMGKYQDKQGYNAVTLTRIGDKDQGAVRSDLTNLLAAMKTTLGDDINDVNFREEDLSNADKILNDPERKDVTVEYHQPPTGSPYLRITGIADKATISGKIPVTIDYATKRGFYKNNEALYLEESLRAGRRKQVGTEVLEEATGLSVGRVGKYHVKYDVSNNSGSYRVTLRGTDNKGTKFELPIDQARPFTNTQQIVAWLSGMLQNTPPGVGEQLITKAIMTKTQLPRETPSGAGPQTTNFNR